MMKRTAITMAILCFTASSAWAQDASDDTASDSAEVDLRVNVFEVINVTAEKPASDAAEVIDSELAAILDEAEALEEDAEPVQ